MEVKSSEVVHRGPGHREIQEKGDDGSCVGAPTEPWGDVPPKMTPAEYREVLSLMIAIWHLANGGAR